MYTCKVYIEPVGERKGGAMNTQQQNMASIKLTKKRNEPKQISFRVSENEFLKLKQSAEALKMSVPTFVKSKAQGVRLIAPKLDPESGLTIARNLAKIGSNVNQVAKWCNTHPNPSNDEKDRLNANLERIKEELHQIWQQLN